MNCLLSWCKRSVLTQISNCFYTRVYYMQGKRHFKNTKVILTIRTVTNVFIYVMVYQFASAFKTSRNWKILALVMVDTRLVHGEISYYKKKIKNFSTNKFSWNILQHNAYFLDSLMLISTIPLFVHSYACFACLSCCWLSWYYFWLKVGQSWLFTDYVTGSYHCVF